MRQMDNKKTQNTVFWDEGQYGAGIAALMKSLHFSFILLSCLIIGMIIWYFTFGGSFTVSPQESVLVFRFGKFHKKYDEGGWYWEWPYPVSRIVRVSKSDQTVITNNFWYYEKDVFKPADGAPTKQLSLAPGKDGYLLTGDANIIHTEWEFVYQIVDPLKYYINCFCPEDPRKEDEVLSDSKTGANLGTRGPKTLLRTFLEDVILRVSATQKADQALYYNSIDYVNAVENELEKELAYLPFGVRVKERGVRLTAKTAPLLTVDAFQDVTKAELERNTEEQQARAYAIQMENDASAESLKIKLEAEAYKKRVVADVEAESIYFKKILEEYKTNPETVLVALYTDVLADVLKSVKDKFIIRTNPDGKQEVRITINPEPEYSVRKKKKEKDKE